MLFEYLKYSHRGGHIGDTRDEMWNEIEEAKKAFEKKNNRIALLTEASEIILDVLEPLFDLSGAEITDVILSRDDVVISKHFHPSLWLRLASPRSSCR